MSVMAISADMHAVRKAAISLPCIGSSRALAFVMPSVIWEGASMTETHKEAAQRIARPILDRGFKPVALHTYTDATGNPLYWRIRAKHPDTGEKWIRR